MEWRRIAELHNTCVERLKALIVQANSTCSLLDSMTEFPISREVWQNAVEQRVRENDAQNRYQQARDALFKAIRPAKTTDTRK